MDAQSSGRRMHDGRGRAALCRLLFVTMVGSATFMVDVSQCNAQSHASEPPGTREERGLWDQFATWLAQSERDYRREVMRKLTVPAPARVAPSSHARRPASDRATAPVGSREASGGWFDRLRSWFWASERDYRRDVVGPLTTPSGESAAGGAPKLVEAPAPKNEPGAHAPPESPPAAESSLGAEPARKLAEAQAADVARKAEEARLAEQKRVEAARKLAEAQAADAARTAEEARLAEQKRAEAARKLAEAQAADAARTAEEARLAEQKRVEAARKLAEAQAADAARKAEEARLAEQERRDELRRAELRRKARIAEAKTAAPERPPGQVVPAPPSPSGARAGKSGAPETPRAMKDIAEQAARDAADALATARERIAARPSPKAASVVEQGSQEPGVTRRSRHRSATGRRRTHRPACRRAGRKITPPGWYVVRAGDSVWRIAQLHYDNGTLYRLIMRANGRKGANMLIHPCQKILIPRRR